MMYCVQTKVQPRHGRYLSFGGGTICFWTKDKAKAEAHAAEVPGRVLLEIPDDQVPTDVFEAALNG